MLRYLRARMLIVLVPLSACTHSVTAPPSTVLREADLVGGWTMAFQVGALVQLVDSLSISLALTPDAADCGLAADGRFAANTFTGEWVEPSITSQPDSSGTFTMWRKS
jgi:hypothetical protein